MSRPIKYQAWLRGFQEMFIVTELRIEKDIVWVGKDKNGNSWGSAAIDLREFTGLYDRNGKEIYEGDIVRRPTGQLVNVRSFTFDSGSVRTVNYLIHGYQYTLDDEVIGNIYENPELLSSVRIGE